MQHKYTLMAFFFSSFILFTAGAGADTHKSLPQNGTSDGQALVNALKIEPPPSFCSETVPLNEAEVKERLEREFLYALDNKDQVILWLKRANRFFPHIEQVLQKNAVPDDLKYIAIAESALKPLATSNKGAVGHWQFIEGTGSRYGMKINSDIDERRDFYKSTEAAAAYLKNLYALFGSWTLAAAAYNMGEEGLKAEMLVQKVNNYYQLYLPQETQRYVFRILSAKIIMSNPRKYGFSLAKEDLYQPLQFDQLEITSNESVPISLVARAANTYFKVIKDLNPQLKKYYLPAGKHQILIPKGSAAGFDKRYENLLLQWQNEKKENVYIIKKGDKLSTIAARFGVPMKAIVIWNGITFNKKMVPGDKLFIFSSNFNPENNTEKSDAEN